eukprot:3918808-Alexandrium_andersonii.AAC.1
MLGVLGLVLLLLSFLGLLLDPPVEQLRPDADVRQVHAVLREEPCRDAPKPEAQRHGVGRDSEHTV